MDYEIETGGHQKRCKVLHVNLLHKWKEPDVAQVFMVLSTEEVVPEELEDFCVVVGPHLQTETWVDVDINPALEETEQSAVSEPLESFSDFFTDVPGKTALVEHDVLTIDQLPVRQKPHCLPHAMKEVVKSELDKMLDIGVVQPSQSPYVSPIVLVHPTGKPVCFRIDYRKINAKNI